MKTLSPSLQIDLVMFLRHFLKAEMDPVELRVRGSVLLKRVEAEYEAQS